MANYKPVQKDILASNNKEGIVTHLNLSTANWSLALFQGYAKSPTGSALISGAVAVWEGSTPNFSNAPGHLTFTDGSGKYGVTVKSGVKLTILYYAK